ncbi:hypothetical protein MANES_02G024400v8 [Manihot esculenta]|uniref:Uncharacterized protein n=1 Tax=Manihot esculenta TaxID=3983 RepID=A0A251LER5_MANES|nr:hypothetical protein MANES_02G024400v8 [Manihot esculenta]
MAILSSLRHLSMGWLRPCARLPTSVCLCSISPLRLLKPPVSHFSPSKYFSAFACVYTTFSSTISHCCALKNSASCSLPKIQPIPCFYLLFVHLFQRLHARLLTGVLLCGVSSLRL